MAGLALYNVGFDMTEFLATGAWDRLQAEASKSSRRVCAVAYLHDANAIRLRESDIVVVDASNDSIAQGKTSALAVESLHLAGVQIWSLGHLHAKIYVFDNCVVVGSTNMSRNSQETLHEACMITSDAAVMREARRHVEQLVSIGAKIDGDFVERIKQIEVVSRPMGDSSPLEDEAGVDRSVKLHMLVTTPTGKICCLHISSRLSKRRLAR